MSSHNPLPVEFPFGRIVANAFREGGWNVADEPVDPPHNELAPNFLASGHGKKLVIELKRASEGRKDRVIPLLSQAALEAMHYSRNLAGHPLPVAIVGANRISDSVAEEVKQFVRERAPGVAVGVVDLEGFRLFAGHGLESLNSPRRANSEVHPQNLRARAPQLFSDLNQWMLKVLLAPRISEECLSAPRRHYQGASQLAEAAGVSIMSAFRFVEELSKAGFLDSEAGLLRPVRLKELMNRWATASQRRVVEIPMRWVLHRGKSAFRSALRSYQENAMDGASSSLLGPRPRLCLGLFEAAQELGVGFVHGVKPHLYVERLNAAVLKELGLSEKVSEEAADLYVRIPGNRENVFRGIVRKNGVPVSDILQVWLDVSQSASRGKEQADLIWRRVLSPALESAEP